MWHADAELTLVEQLHFDAVAALSGRFVCSFTVVVVVVVIVVVVVLLLLLCVSVVLLLIRMVMVVMVMMMMLMLMIGQAGVVGRSGVVVLVVSRRIGAVAARVLWRGRLGHQVVQDLLVFLEVLAIADERRIFAELVETLGRHRLERAPHHRILLEHGVEVLHGQRVQVAVGERLHARRSLCLRQQAYFYFQDN